jgi:hypothetical protein
METTHYSIVDHLEMPLPQQQLLMRVMVQSITVMTWVLLNNEMDEVKPGVPNMFGL